MKRYVEQVTRQAMFEERRTGFQYEHVLSAPKPPMRALYVEPVAWRLVHITEWRETARSQPEIVCYWQGEIEES